MMNELILSYAIYLRDTLFEYNGGGGDMYWRLHTFIESGYIKDVIKPSDKDYSRIDVLNSMCSSISSYLKSRGDIVDDLMRYNEFISSKRNDKLESIGI